MATRDIQLPSPHTQGGMPVEQALDRRRSVREYKPRSLSPAQVAQLLWAAQGVTEKRPAPSWWPGDREWGGGLRAAPSAGALYPLELYVAVGDVKDIPPGCYRYRPRNHTLTGVLTGDIRPDLAGAALGQEPIAGAPVVLILTAVAQRTARKYGDRAVRYVHMEIGHAGQNIYMQAESLGLATVMMGAFRDTAVRNVLELSEEEDPFAIMPVGYPAG